MNRIDKLFSEKKKNILSIYFTAGFPKLNDSIPILEALEKDVIDAAMAPEPWGSRLLADGVAERSHFAAALQRYLFSLDHGDQRRRRQNMVRQRTAARVRRHPASGGAAR